MTDERWIILKRLCLQDFAPGNLHKPNPVIGKPDEGVYYFTPSNLDEDIRIEWPDYPKEIVRVYRKSPFGQAVPLHMLTTILHAVNLS